jgi:nucleotide-binding universal stress UspA family protein
MNEIRSILLHVDNASTGRMRLLTAQAVAKDMGAQLEALYAVTPVHMMYPYVFAAEAPLAAQMAHLEQDQRNKQHAVFEQLRAAAGDGPKVQWHETHDEPTRGFVERAWAADLLVLGQHASSDTTFSGVNDDFVSSVLIDSGKPALVLPYIHQGPVKSQTVLMAWKPTPQAARAATAALPWLKRARQVHVATWMDHAAKPINQPINQPLAIDTWLRHHGINAVLHHEAPAGRDLGDLLLSVAADVQAELLVMGCYGHSRTREWLLGGATRTVLRSMTLPVLMSH